MGDIKLHRTPLQEMKADAIAYGAKDTGEMGGGTATAVLVACGERVMAAAREELAKTTRQIGEAVITPFDLEPSGIRWIVHVVSIIKNTPQGAWCPKPEKLKDGVMKGLRLASEKGARSIAFAMLGTNEGRVKPDDAARIMIAGIREFQRVSGSPIEVHFSLPSHRIYDAVERRLSGRDRR